MRYGAVFSRLAHCRGGGTAAEFALVLPLFLFFLFGIIDGGRLLWEINQAEKATQVGARFAIVTDPVSPDLVDADYTSGSIAAGDLIPHTELGTLRCSSTTCDCPVSPCPGGGTVNSAAFSIIATRMQAIHSGITADKVRIRYSGSGFGYAGDPVGGGGGAGATETMEVSPLVTVSVTGLQFRPITLLLLRTITLPDYHTTLTAEDASGAYSN